MTSNLMLEALVVNRDVFWPDYSARAIQHNTWYVYVDTRHLWLTRLENRGKRSQNCKAKLTRPFLSCEGARPRVHAASLQAFF